jgi:hypothetical protein
MITTHRLTVHRRTLAARSLTTAVCADPVVNARQHVANAFPDQICDTSGQFPVGNDTHVRTIGRADDGCTEWTDRGPADRGNRRAGR